MEEYYALIVAMDEAAGALAEPAFRQKINGRYEIWYYDKTVVPPLSIADYTYAALPKCYGLTNNTSLEASGILRLQNQPTLSLTGQGVFVAVIDTGIRYQDAAFQTEDKKSRIFSMWDQTAERRSEETDPLVLYGRTYAKEELDRALSSGAPESVVPERDDNGHGTFLASVACGSPAPRDDFTGAAPQSQLIVVKLKEAGGDLRRLYAIPPAVPAYAESDIMAGIAYAERIARTENRPLVILLGLGTNHGGHSGTSPLCDYEDMIAATRHRAVVNAVGNEGNSRHHYYGTARDVLVPAKVEINVGEDMQGLWAELWTPAPEQLAISVQSPTGELAPKRAPFQGESGNYSFLFEGTRLSIDYRDAGKNRRDQLIYLRFSDIKKGIWTLRVYPQNSITGAFHVWLPMRQMMYGEAFFLESDPDVTLTSPADAEVSMSVGGYNALTGALYVESGRGFDASGRIKPDFAAPAAELRGRGLRDNYVTYSGTSGAAAITAGACAQLLEWAVVRGNAIGINSTDIKNLLCRGADRSVDERYPNKTLGYGKMNIYSSFDSLRG